MQASIIGENILFIYYQKTNSILINLKGIIVYLKYLQYILKAVFSSQPSFILIRLKAPLRLSLVKILAPQSLSLNLLASSNTYLLGTITMFYFLQSITNYCPLFSLLTKKARLLYSNLDSLINPFIIFLLRYNLSVLRLS